MIFIALSGADHLVASFCCCCLGSSFRSVMYARRTPRHVYLPFPSVFMASELVPSLSLEFCVIWHHQILFYETFHWWMNWIRYCSAIELSCIISIVQDSLERVWYKGQLWLSTECVVRLYSYRCSSACLHVLCAFFRECHDGNKAQDGSFF